MSEISGVHLSAKGLKVTLAGGKRDYNVYCPARWAPQLVGIEMGREISRNSYG